MPHVQLSRVRMHYYEHGHGPETVVFVHGFQASARIWQLVQEALPSDRYRSIAANNRGAGETDAPPDEADFSIEHFAADLYELVTALGLRDFTLAGHSLGGATVARFAVDHPELIKGLVLLDPAPPDGPELSPDEIERLVEERITRRQTQRGAGDGIDPRAGGEGARGEFLRLLAADIAAAPERRLRGSARSRLGLHLGAAVKTLPIPVLLACGDADKLIPIEAMVATWAMYPSGSGLHVWHGVGHSPNVDIPEELAALLQRFITETTPARREAVAAG